MTFLTEVHSATSHSHSGPLGSTRVLHLRPLPKRSLFLFLRTNLTSLEEARFLFLEHLGQCRANEHEKKKEGTSYPASERFLPQSLTHPHLTGSLLVPPPTPDITTQESTNRSLSSSVRVELKCMWGDKLLTVVRSQREHVPEVTLGGPA